MFSTLPRLLVLACVATFASAASTSAAPRTVATANGRIAFTTWTGGLGSVNADGSGNWGLDRDPTDAAPAWAPDGARVAISAARNHDSDIYVLQPDGSHPQQLTQSMF